MLSVRVLSRLLCGGLALDEVEVRRDGCAGAISRATPPTIVDSAMEGATEGAREGTCEGACEAGISRDVVAGPRFVYKEELDDRELPRRSTTLGARLGTALGATLGETLGATLGAMLGAMLVRADGGSEAGMLLEAEDMAGWSRVREEARDTRVEGARETAELLVSSSG